MKPVTFGRTIAAPGCRTSQRWPITVQLEITDRCNMRCPMCITSDHCGNPRMDTLSAEFIRERVLIPLRKRGVQAVSLSGGEPTLSPHLIEIIREAKGLGFRIFLATNALSERRHPFAAILEAMSDSAWAAIQVSFDSHYPEEMSAIRGGDYFSRVRGNLRTLREMTRSRYRRIRLVCAIVVQEENARSFLETADYLLNAVGVDRVVIQPRHDFSEVDASNWMAQEPLALSVGAREAALKNVAFLFERASRDDRIQVIGGSLKNWEAFFRKPTDMRVTCNAAKRVFVDPYGNLRGCIHSKIIGSVKQTDIDHFLDSDPYAAFLEFSKACNICIHGCAR